MRYLFYFICFAVITSGCAVLRNNTEEVVVICPWYGEFPKNVTTKDLKMSSTIRKEPTIEEDKMMNFFRERGVSFLASEHQYIFFPEAALEASKMITPKSQAFLISNSEDNLKKIYRLFNEMNFQCYVMSKNFYDPEKFFADPFYGIKEQKYIYVSKGLLENE